MSERIAYTRPSITELEISYATDAAANGWGAQCYSYIERFEQEFAARFGVKHAIATSSCTGALHMGLAALGIRAGDEVILADTNWVASVAPVIYLGAKPVFVDILPDSWCLDPQQVLAAITPRTRAIIAVHLYGNLCEMDALRQIADEHGIALIEDAAEAIGSNYRGEVAGSMGRFATFSFHGTKTMTTGEGGMFVTNDSELYQQVLMLSNHGRVSGQRRQFWPEAIGFKYKMSNVQAAIGCAQLSRIDELVGRKRAILQAYKQALHGCPLILNPEPEYVVNGAWMPTAVFAPDSGVDSGKLQQAFSAANIDARVFFSPLSSTDMFTACPQNRHAWEIPSRAINLPSYHDMSDSDLARVADVVVELCV